MKEIGIKITASIVENKELSSLSKLILGLGFTYSQMAGYNMLTNKEIAELFSINENTIGKHRKTLLDKGYERNEKGKYYLTDKYKEFKPIHKRDIIIPSEVYKKRINVGAKLLWGEYNSLSNKGQNEAFAARDYYAARLNCSVDSITNWFMELVDNELLSDYGLFGGRGARQRRVKTVDFSKGSNSMIPVALERRKEIWNEYIGDKSYLKRNVNTEKQAWEYAKDLRMNIIAGENEREIVSSLLADIDTKMKGTDILDKLREIIQEALKGII